MISASHNPYYDNGIKLINGQGEKMEESVIALVEDYLDGNLVLFGKKWIRCRLPNGIRSVARWIMSPEETVISAI